MNATLRLERQDLFRRLAVAFTFLGTPGFVVCATEHFCMDGHMAHPPYSIWHRVGDLSWILFFGMGAIAALRSNMRSRGWLTGLLLTMTLGQFLLGGLPCLEFIALPGALLIAVQGFRRDPVLLPIEVCSCGYDLTGNVSGVCPECGESAHRVVGPER